MKPSHIGECAIIILSLYLSPPPPLPFAFPAAYKAVPVASEALPAVSVSGPRGNF